MPCDDAASLLRFQVAIASTLTDSKNVHTDPGGITDTET